MSRVGVRMILLHCIGLSLTITLSPLSYALTPINSTQDGQIIQGGTYFNTANAKTIFMNSHSDGLWLKSGVTVRGLEVNSSHNLTNNGGTIQLYAPGQVVRVDGNINVNGLTNGHGAYLGSGGKVFVNSAYLYQNGNILAEGNRGGQVNINVNSATFGPLAKIDASSPNGLGGTIRVNASGVVDVQKGAALTTAGLHFPGVDSNLIEVVGRVVNNDGIINANGITANASAQNMNTSSGGIIRIVANSGYVNLAPVDKVLHTGGIFSSSELEPIRLGVLLLANPANSVQSTGSLTANKGTGTLQGNHISSDGGIIQVRADNNATFSGTLSVSKNLDIHAGNDIHIAPPASSKSDVILTAGQNLNVYAGNDILTDGILTSGSSFNVNAGHNFATGGTSSLKSGADFNIRAGNDATIGSRASLISGKDFNISTGHDFSAQYYSTLKSGTKFDINSGHDIGVAGDPFNPVYMVTSGTGINLNAGHDVRNNNTYLKSGTNFIINVGHDIDLNGRQGAMTAGEDLTVKAGNFYNHVALVSGGNLTVNSQGSLYTSGLIKAAKNLNLYGGTDITSPRVPAIYNRGGYLLSTNGNIIANTPGPFTSGYIIEADKGNIFLHGNTFSNESITLGITNYEHSNITAAGKLTINSDHDLVNSASIKSGGDLTLRAGMNTIVHNVQQVTPGSFQNIVGAPGTFPNTPHNVVSTNGKVTINATKDIFNETTIQGHGNVSLSAGTTNPSGTIVVLPGKITNTGTITSDTGTVIENTHP